MRKVSIMLARTKRVNWPVIGERQGSTGSTRWRNWSPKPPSPTVAMPLAGSQCSPTAKTRMSTRASQNTGTEMPAKANRLITPSRHAARTQRGEDAER